MTPRDHLKLAENWLAHAEQVIQQAIDDRTGNVNLDQLKVVDTFARLSLGHSQCAGAHVSVRTYEIVTEDAEREGGVPRGT